jgi:hypothetical protein
MLRFSARRWNFMVNLEQQHNIDGFNQIYLLQQLFSTITQGPAAIFTLISSFNSWI